MNSFRYIPIFAILGILLGACAPTIQVSTPEPVKIDVNMRVDIHTKDDAKKSASKNPEEESPLASRRLSRMGEIQNLKNSRFIGENNKGYLELRSSPEGKLPHGENYADYIQRIVKSENNDRRALYLQNAEKKGDPLDLVEREFSIRWQEISYTGEWIQKEDNSWIQK